jgi:transcriptional regulator with XRE-family HTH domain
MQNRIKEARKKRRLSATELAEKLNVHQTTITNWETGYRQITADKLLQLADILGFTVDYLLGRDSEQVKLTTPIDKNTLPALHGQPVWSSTHGWMLINIVERTFVLYDLSLVSFDKINEPLYLIPPDMSISLRGVGTPLDMDAVSNRERVWVEPISSDSKLCGELRGWYTLYEKRLVQNEFGNRFYLDAYGANWLAFANCLEKR